ncbi:hypothetical protein GCM10020229_53320 [Kitasatospora albolonga]|uniref:sensor histidine kinase n=1 Tax=Kitasatospora albolonga TaxID=68173 RepID=UPI0031E8C54D
MRRRRAAALTPAGRIHRLRRRTALLFALVSALGLVGMAVVAVRAADSSWRAQVDADLTLRVNEVYADLRYVEEGTFAYPDPQEGAYDCPPVTLFTGTGGEVTPLAAAHRPCLAVPAEALRAVAAEAGRSGEQVHGTATASNGHRLRLCALPFVGPEEENLDGVLVAAVDVSGQLDDQDRLVLLLAGACAVLVTLSALAGSRLAGRAVRPALTAIEQQEAFFADAAHDLRTPVASVRLLAETGLRGEADGTEVMRRTLRQATRMGELVDALLVRARLTTGAVPLEREPLRLDQLVDAVVADTPAADGHLVTVRSVPVVVRGDAGLLRRAVANLLGNALLHGHAPGRPAEVEITVGADGTVAVDDAGPGIPPERARSLFERFHSGAGSSGLGLSIAAWVAHAHGGSLTVVPSARGGARFVLRVPVRRQP